VVIDLAAKHAPGALVVESTFTSLVELAKVHYPYFPVSLLVRDRYESAAKIGKVACPVLIFHGEGDELVPLSMARALFDAANEPKRLIVTPGGHNEAGFTYTPDYATMMRQFVTEAVQ
jgi:hypothetical protein